MSKKQRQTEISRRQALGGIVAAGAIASMRGPAQAQSNHAQSNQGWGRVFVFNTASEPVDLELNRGKLPAIVGTQRGDYYIPDVIVVDRSTMPSSLVTGEFAAKNSLGVRYPGGLAIYEIVIDPEKFQIGLDLQLYVHRDGVVLLHNGEAVTKSVRKIL